MTQLYNAANYPLLLLPRHGHTDRWTENVQSIMGLHTGRTHNCMQQVNKDTST